MDRMKTIRSREEYPLRFYRRIQRYSQKEIASALGTSQRRVSQVEAGIIPIRWDEVERLAAIYRCSAEELREGPE